MPRLGEREQSPLPSQTNCLTMKPDLFLLLNGIDGRNHLPRSQESGLGVAGKA